MRKNCRLLTFLLFAAAFTQGSFAQETTAQHFSVPVPDHSVIKLIAYGDMRFTDPTESVASKTGPRRSLVNSIASEMPGAIFLTGDVPWHGGVTEDYQVYQKETDIWQKSHIPVYPALGNHEFARCEVQVCLANWWHTFPELAGLRWYSVQVGAAFRAIALDTDDSLLEGSPQRTWLEKELGSFSAQEKFVMLYLHHPPLADIEAGDLASHNPRKNELDLADYLSTIAKKNPHIHFLVIAGHIHNYEHLEKDGVLYLVSGGGGAKPYPVTRSKEDHYVTSNAVNFHYIRMNLEPTHLHIEMVRLTDPDAESPHNYEVADSIDLTAN